jgi:2-dehydropantoate 2-reductase
MLVSGVKRIYFLGLGALGSIYAFKIQAILPETVKIIADHKRIKAFKRSGITINGKAYTFNFISPDDRVPPADLIIIAVKYPALETAIQDIKGFVGQDTIILSLLNGISSEEIIGKYFGMEHLVYAYGVGMDAERQQNNIRYTNPGKIVFGEKNNAILSERVIAIKKVFELAEIPFDIPEDMYRALWYKFMLNVGINQASALLKAPYGIFQKYAEANDIMVMAAREVLALSEKNGVFLNESDITEFIKTINGLDPHGKTSMLQDVEAGRKTEVEIFSGAVIELGRKYQVPTPVNDLLYRAIKAAELTYGA